MEAQISPVIKSVFPQLCPIAQLHPYLDKKCLTTVVYALVISKIDYSNSLDIGLLSKLEQKLQQFQNAAAEPIIGISSYEHISLVLAHLRWFPVNFCAQFKVLDMTYEALNGLGPQYLLERLLHKTSISPNHSLQFSRLKIVTLKLAKRSKTKSHAF